MDIEHLRAAASDILRKFILGLATLITIVYKSIGYRLWLEIA